MGKKDIEDLALSYRDKLSGAREKLEKESALIDEVLDVIHEEDFESLRVHKFVLRGLLPPGDYAMALSMTRVTEDEFEDLYDSLTVDPKPFHPRSNSNIDKDISRVYTAVMSQGYDSVDYYLPWIRKINVALSSARFPPSLTRLVDESLLYVIRGK
ncbi:hypothetical protein [Eastern grey kangaroopox virus]|uniref:Uncharacterized protein n=1 Tax=Eastern grey kangaroopox virus TaxID=2042482 RepID=A0A2C9DSY7_9POXV|nr:hypothetical protein KM541_gp024 [Eastern grey kangaroopox virus]ATI21120.1 hypothetical protein [Eastern grey kangaroopox virus]AXK50168.1 hypothetical protein EKPV-NSW-ORF037 [Eastern grey kangaroopox virus]